MAAGVIIFCVFVIIGLTYRGVGAYLRDRERNTQGRGGNGQDPG